MQQNVEQPQTMQEHKLAELVGQLIRHDLDLVGRAILKAVRLKRYNEPVPTQPGKTDVPVPTGPYATRRRMQLGDLLIFVPRALDSYLIDDLTGGYGYSHVAVDCGEDDLPTGQPVMVESTVGRTVERRFQHEYGQRPFVRINLARTGLAVDKFCECVQSKLGQPYDAVEALTWGMVDDPAKQVCSDLAAVCLPDEVREDIADARRKALLHRHSVSVHSRPSTHGVREFISPNGFAEYYGAPKGEDIHRPDYRVAPKPVTAYQVQKRLKQTGHITWRIGATLGTAFGVWLLYRYLRG